MNDSLSTISYGGKVIRDDISTLKKLKKPVTMLEQSMKFIKHLHSGEQEI